MIHILVAASSAVCRSVLKEILLKSKKFEWCGEAVSYDSLRFMAKHLRPDVIIADKTLFDLERNSALYDYCHSYDIPSIIYHARGEKIDYSSKNIKFEELPEFINFTTRKCEEYALYLEKLIVDIKCNVLLENHMSASAPVINEDGTISSTLKDVSKTFAGQKFQAVLIGVSTGGPGALLELIKGIGNGFPLPIFITQHIDSFFDKNLIHWLSSESHVPVELAENDVKPLAGHIYFAPSDEHLVLIPHSEDGFHMALNHDAPVNFLRPAVDKMFESAARVLGANCIAVILTGMGTDGAKECLHLKNLGAYTITQDEASSVIYGMPKAAYENGGSCEVLPLKQIPLRLWSLTEKEALPVMETSYIGEKAINV